MNRRDFLKASISASILPVITPWEGLLNASAIGELWADDVLLTSGPLLPDKPSLITFSFKESVEAAIKIVLRVPDPTTGRTVVLERPYGWRENQKTTFINGESITLDCPPVRIEGDNILFGTPEEIANSTEKLNSTWTHTWI